MKFFRRCLRCGKCEAEEVNYNRWDCQSCKFTWFPEELIISRSMAYVDRSKKKKLFIEVPFGCMAVFDVGKMPTSEYVSMGEI